MKRQFFKTAAALALAAAVMVLALEAGCSSSGKKEGIAASTAAKTAAGDTVALAEEKGVQNGKATESTQTAADSASSARKIARSARLQGETTEYDQTTKSLVTLVDEYGGYLETSSVQGKSTGNSDKTRNASYTVRVPSEKLDAFLEAVGNVATVTEREIFGKDLTQSYVDTQARLKVYEVEQTRLLDLMKKAEKAEDLLNIEKRLTEVQTQIEQMTAEIKNMDSLVGFATVSITIREVEVIRSSVEKTLVGQFGQMIVDSFHALGKVLKYLLLAVAAILPFAAVAGIVVAVVFWIRRRRKSAGKKNEIKK